MRMQKLDERGATMIMVAVSMVCVFAFAVLAIDTSLIQLAKTQLQNAADAAALAAALEYGATAGDEAATTAEAIRIAGMNDAIQTTQQPVVITDGDVTFPLANQVRVQTHRTVATNDPVKLYFMRVLDGSSTNQGNMTASATAMLTPIGGTNCLKPWVFPDRWNDANGNGLYDNEETYDPETTGYSVPDDVGLQITLKYASGGTTPSTGWYQPVSFGAVNRGGPDCPGADCYREAIYGCEPYTIYIGDTLRFQTGNMIGPTRQGWRDLIALDPNATFNTSTGLIENSTYSTSPRMIKVAMYDPTVGVITSGASGAEKNTVVSKFAYLFIENVGNGAQVPVTARFMQYTSGGEPCPTCPNGFLFTSRLVE
jgi:Flp pilus assembly protein TadG